MPYLFERSTAPAPSTVISWDAGAEMFAHLTLDPAGRILARMDLDPAEKQAAIRALFIGRTTSAHRHMMGRFLNSLGLLIDTSAAKGGAAQAPSVAALNVRFAKAARRSEAEAFAETMETTIKSLLVLAWAVNMARSAPGQPLPALEDIDHDLPYYPPMGPSMPTAPIDGAALLEEMDLEGSEADHDSWSLRPHG